MMIQEEQVRVLFAAEDRMACIAAASAERFVREVFLRDGVVLGFDRESVEWLDAHIEDLIERTGKETADYVELTLGAYLGECVRRAFGGRWAYHPRLEQWAIFVSGYHLFPRAQVMARYLDGAGESLATYFLRLRWMLHTDR